MTRKFEIRTLQTTAGACPDRHTCESVHVLEGQPDRRRVIGKTVTDQEELDAFRHLMADDETLSDIPDWLAHVMLDVRGLGDFIDAHYQQRGDTLFRMEQLPAYSVDSDGSDWERWQAGATEPTWSRKQPWLDQLRQDKANGLVSQRVRVFSEHLTDYELYACHMGYAHNAEFEDIRVLRRGEHNIPDDLVELDYWIVGDKFVLPMTYDGRGRFIGASVLPESKVEELKRDRDRAWEAAEPFPHWWARHQELHRRMAA